MHLTGRNNPCGEKEEDRDASDRGKVIPVVKKRKTGMHSVGRNNPCGAKEQDRDASDRGKVIPVVKKRKQGCIQSGEIIPVEQKCRIGMHLTGAK